MASRIYAQAHPVCEACGSTFQAVRDPQNKGTFYAPHNAKPDKSKVVTINGVECVRFPTGMFVPLLKGGYCPMGRGERN